MLEHLQTMPYRMVVRDEYDIITMRQEVRQMARNLGLTLTQQAKITAGVSGIARVLLNTQERLCLQIKTVLEGRHPALEVVYLLPGSQISQDQLEAVLKMDEARLLVDEATISTTPEHAQIALRMWLS